MTELVEIAEALVSRGKGILAADETASTLSKRFDALQIASTPESRRDYRELLIATPGANQFISGVILYDETIRQRSARGTALANLCSGHGLIPGIKVDTGAKPMAGHDGERITEGLDGLRERLAEYRRMGARFAKWRGVFEIDAVRPTPACIAANAHALARYAALCHEQGLVPIVEPEVLMDGPHAIERCELVTEQVLNAVFNALFEQRIRLEQLLLKPNMVVSGLRCAEQAGPARVAEATLRCLRRHVPAAVAGVVFLSGGQDDVTATQNLDAVNRASGTKPWTLSFSYGRALQNAALAAWRGKPENVRPAQRAFYHRARCNGLAVLGAYSDAEERHLLEPAAE